MIDAVLSWIGIAAICYAVFRALQALADSIVRRDEVRDVMTGRAVAPWEPTVRVRRPLYDQSQES